MKKIICLLMFVITLVGCQKIHYWDFHYDYERISEIKIVEAISETEYREVKKIDLSFAREIYMDISNIKMKRYGTNLSSPFGKCFLIVFDNGEYDIIAQKEPKHFRYDGEYLLGHNSWLCCEEKDFNALINKYLNNS